ncbi:MAG: hypothetical protein WKF65_08370 [Gaiellaceae bacterium]
MSLLSPFSRCPAALTAPKMMMFEYAPRELTGAVALYESASPARGTAGVFLGGMITGCSEGTRS